MNLTADQINDGDRYSESNCFGLIKATLRKEFQWPWKFLEFIECALYILLGVVNCIVFAYYTSDSRIAPESDYFALLETLAIFSPLASIYAVLTYKLRPRLWLNFSLNFFFIICPILSLIIILITNSFYHQLRLAILAIFVAITALGLRLHSSLQKIFIKEIGELKGRVVGIGLVIVFGTLFPIVVCAITLETEIMQSPIKFLTYLSPLYFLGLIMIWTFIHYYVYKEQPNEMIRLKREIIKIENPSMKLQSLLTTFPNLLKAPSITRLQKYGSQISSIVIILVTIGIEIGMLVAISHKENYSQNGLNLIYFYVAAVPCFVVIGTLFSASALKTTENFQFWLVLLTIGPTLGIMKASFTLYSDPDTYYLGILIGLGIPGSILYWFTMSMVHSYNARTFQYFTSVFCLLLFLPFGLLLPLYLTDSISAVGFGLTFTISLLLSVALGLNWFFHIGKKISMPLIKLILEVKGSQTTEVLRYVYSSSFLLCHALLGWSIFKRLDYANDWISGLVSGCYAILGLMILGTILINRLKLFESDPNAEFAFRDIVMNKASETPMYRLYKQKKKQYQFIISFLGTIIILATALPIMLSSSNSTSYYSGITIIVGFSIVTLLILVLLELKTFLRQFGDLVAASTLGCCWLFVLIPFICIIPAVYTTSEDSQEQENVTSWTIGAFLLLFMLGVTFGSITLNLLFRKLDNEKVAKFCCVEVKKNIENIGVKAKLDTLRIIYDNFKVSGAENIEKILANETAFSYREIEEDDENDQDFKYSKEILTIKEAIKFRNNITVNLTDKSFKKIEKVGKFKQFLNWLKKICGAEAPPVRKKSKLNTENSLGSSKINPDISQEENQEGEVEEEENLEAEIDENALNDNWGEVFKKVIQKYEEKQIKLHEEYLESQEPGEGRELQMKKVENIDWSKVRIDKITAKKLSKADKDRLRNSEHLRMLMNNPELKLKWMKEMFSRFSSIKLDYEGEPTMNLSEMRQFIRLSGLKQFIPNAQCDLVFTKLTKIYNKNDFTVTHKKITLEVFVDLLIPELGKIFYPKLDPELVAAKLFAEEIYPYIVSNLPYLASFDPGNTEEVIAKVPVTQQPDSTTRTEKKKRIVTVVPEPKEEPPLLIERTFIGRFLSRIGGFFTTTFGKCFKMCLNCFNFGDSPKQNSDALQNDSEYVRKIESPEWAEVSKQVVQHFIDSETEASSENKPASVKMELNSSNVLGIVSSVLEIYSFSAIGFSSQVGWLYGKDFSKTTDVVLADNSYWVETFWACFGLSAVFIGLVIPALKAIRQGRLGLNPDFTVAEFPSFQFFLTRLISIIGSSFYLTIISAMLAAFSCGYSNGKWHLLRASSIECFSDEHLVYFFIAIFCLLLYYPLGTLLYPNIAFQDKALDIKFTTTFIVLESQGKVIISAFFVFFPKEQYIWLQLAVSILVALFLMGYSWNYQPCLIKEFNLWKTGGFLFPIWICGCALLNYYSDQTVLAVVLLVVGLGAIVGGLFTTHYRRLRKAPQKEMIELTTTVIKEGDKVENDFLEIEKRHDVSPVGEANFEEF